MKKLFVGILMLIILVISTVPAISSCCWEVFYPNRYTKVIKYDCDCNGWAEYEDIYKLTRSGWVYTRTVYY